MATQRKQKTIVVMFHNGRCGSNVLTDMLNQHQQIKWMGEKLKTKFKRAIAHHSLEQYLKKNVFFWANNKHPIVGFEVKFWHLTENCNTSLPAFIALIVRMAKENDCNLKFVVLNRNNMLLKLISSEFLKRKGLAQKPSNKPPRKLTRIEIDCEDLVGKFQEWELQFTLLDQMLQSNGFQPLRLQYKEHILLQGPILAYQMCLQFLSLNLKFTKTNPRPEVHYRKLNPFRPKQMLENYTDVFKELHDTPYQWMLSGE